MGEQYVPEAPAPSGIDYSSFKVPELKTELSKLGLSTKGIKKVICRSCINRGNYICYVSVKRKSDFPDL